MLDLNQMALYHYCHPGCEPFRNIMRLPKEEAFRFARELAEKNPQSTAFYRFADFENYYSHRIKTDTELYRRFTACGGRPAQAHPLSFVLGGSDFLHSWFGGGQVYCLPLCAVPPEAVSFTAGDSCAATERGRNCAFYTKTQLAERLCEYSGTAEAFFQEIVRSCTYIEAQLWEDACLVHARRIG